MEARELVRYLADRADDFAKQLEAKTQECEEQENKIKKLRKNLALEIESVDRYRKALEEIETLAQRKKSCLFECKSMEKILGIINKAKEE